MRASDALLLGSTMLRPLRGIFIKSDADEGCALGMIVAANHGIAECRRKMNGLLLPWMTAFKHTPLPCDCQEAVLMGSCGYSNSRSMVEASPQTVIVHLFNQHVCDGTWSIERLADYIRSIEPAEPEVKETVNIAEPIAYPVVEVGK